MTLDETHDPSRRSWVDAANDPATDFPIQNLPFGVFRRRDSADVGRVGVAIGDQIVDILACLDAGLLDVHDVAIQRVCGFPRLNELMAFGRGASTTLRHALANMLDASRSSDVSRYASRILLPMQDAELLLPADIGDYTDFYASIH